MRFGADVKNQRLCDESASETSYTSMRISRISRMLLWCSKDVFVPLFVHNSPEAQESLEISEAFQEVRNLKFQCMVPEAGLEPARF